MVVEWMSAISEDNEKGTYVEICRSILMMVIVKCINILNYPKGGTAIQ